MLDLVTTAGLDAWEPLAEREGDVADDYARGLLDAEVARWGHGETVLRALDRTES